MRCAPLLAAGLLAGSGLALSAALSSGKEADPADPARPARLLPGVQPDGFVQLPNQWRLRPAGRHLEVGDFPLNLALHPSGQYLAALHCGYREHEIVIVDLNPARQKIVSRTVVDQAFYGLCFAPDGRRIYASGAEFEVVHEFAFERGLLSNHRQIPVGGDIPKFIVGGLATDAAGRDLFVAGTWGDVVVRVPIDNPDNRTVIPLTAKNVKPEPAKGEPPSPPDGRKVDGAAPAKPKEGELVHYPYACLPEPGGKRLFVTLWGNRAVAVIDLAKNEVAATWRTEPHPTEMVLSPDGKALYVSCANSTKVSVLDTASGATLQTISCSLYPTSPNGNTPNSLALTPDGDLLFVSNADANNLAVLNVADPKAAKPLGFIPTGWYPTSVRFNPRDKMIYVANGKGVVSRANRAGPSPYGRPGLGNLAEYIGGLYRGALSTIELPSPNRLAAYSKQAFACSPLRGDQGVVGDAPADSPIPRKVGEASPIKHVIYIIKENRTYDQVFGDLPQGNGEPGLCLFPAAVTPNHHKLATEFVLLDNFYVEGEVSADGHEWSMAAYATDYVEKQWPLSYRGSPRKKLGYPSEGANDWVARPSGGYIWDRCAEAKVTYRSYGEWIANGKKNPDGTFEDSKATVKALEGHFDPKFRGYDLEYPDVKRAARFIEELRRFEKEGAFPQFTILRLPNDHTSGTIVGKPTPTAMVADNDLALGQVVEAVSKSKFWPTTAIFVVEDDAQNGPDHVDAHRAVALVVSPYTKRNHVDSTMYSTSSMLRTMELILGLQPMSQFDAAARPMYHSFQAKPDVRPYTHEVPKTDLNATNKATAWGADLTEKMNLAKEDQADDLLFNEVIWRSVRGPHSKMPAPVRAAFVLPKAGGEKDDDD